MNSDHSKIADHLEAKLYKRLGHIAEKIIWYPTRTKGRMTYGGITKGLITKRQK